MKRLFHYTDTKWQRTYELAQKDETYTNKEGEVSTQSEFIIYVSTDDWSGISMKMVLAMYHDEVEATKKFGELLGVIKDEY